MAANNGKKNGDQTDDSPARKNCPARPSCAAYGPINGFLLTHMISSKTFNVQGRQGNVQ